VLTGVAIAGWLVTNGTPEAAAQAFVPAAGEGTVSVSYQVASTSGQLGIFGRVFPDLPLDKTRTHALIWHVDYGLNDRIAVHASVPYMMVRYEGPFPHDIGIKGQPSDVDDGTYHGSFQDFYFGTRFKLRQSARFALTPFVEVIVPSHHYESLGQAVVGRDLRALVVGAAVGGFADYLLPGLYFQTRLSHAVVQEAVDIRPNRTGIDSAIGYFVTPRLAIQFVQTFQLTHDGIDFRTPSEVFALHKGGEVTFEHILNHDRLIRSNVLNLGGGVTFAVTENVGVFASATTMAWGQNVQRPRSLTVGANWSFQTRRSPSPSNPRVSGGAARRLQRLTRVVI
jgi:hypothetical protein